MSQKRHQGFLKYIKYGLVSYIDQKKVKKFNWYCNTFKNKNGDNKIVRGREHKEVY